MAEQTRRTLAEPVYMRQNLGAPAREPGVFTAPESLLAFPIATSVVATVTRAARTIGGVDSDSIIAPMIAAVLIGAVIFGLTLCDHAARPRTPKDWAISAFVAAVNSLVLFAAALGIEKF